MVYYKRGSGLLYDLVCVLDKLNNNIVVVNRFWKLYFMGDILRVIVLVGVMNNWNILIEFVNW